MQQEISHFDKYLASYYSGSLFLKKNQIGLACLRIDLFIYIALAQ